MAKVGCCLSRFLTQHEELRANQPESVNNNFAFDGLDRVDDDSNGSSR